MKPDIVHSLLNATTSQQDATDIACDFRLMMMYFFSDKLS